MAGQVDSVYGEDYLHIWTYANHVKILQPKYVCVLFKTEANAFWNLDDVYIAAYLFPLEAIYFLFWEANQPIIQQNVRNMRLQPPDVKACKLHLLFSPKCNDGHYGQIFLT